MPCAHSPAHRRLLGVDQIGSRLALSPPLRSSPVTPIVNTSDASAETGFRLRLVPLLITAGLSVAIPTLAVVLTGLAGKAFLASWRHGPDLSFLYLQHGFQLALALIAITVMKRFVPGDYGLHWPRGKTYVRPAILWSALLGMAMLIVGEIPHILAGTKPDLDYPLTRGNVIGWLFFEGVYVGPTEEIPFRSLLVTYLAATMPGKLRLRRFEMNWAGLVVAALFALAHITSFVTDPWPLALAQQGFAFAFGVLYAYWLEKSQSIMAPIVGHNIGDVMSQGLLFLWVGL